MTQWLTDWTEDIDQLARELPRLHANVFHHCSEQSFYAQIDQLKSDLPMCDNAMVVVRVMALIASIGDAHTALIPPASHFLPYAFYWFAEGMHIIAARPEYQDDLGSQLVAIEGQPVSLVIDQLTRIIAHENDAYITSHLPSYLTMVDLLYGLEICDSTDSIVLTLQRSDGESESKAVMTVRHHDLATGMIGLENELPGHGESPFSRLAVPFHRNHHDRSFWFTALGTDSIYIQYNACRELPDNAMPAVFADLLQQVERLQPSKLIFDLRHNHGGDSTVLEPLIDAVTERVHAAQDSIQVFVIIGRDTFSSALLNAYALKNKTGATIVGEPSGGKPNCYGEVQYLVLNHTRLRVRYSTRYYHLVDDDTLLSLMPDRACAVTFADFLAGHDPCLAACATDSPMTSSVLLNKTTDA